MISCPKCNNDNADDAKHCGYCGAQLRAQEQKRTMFGMAAVPPEELERLKAEALAAKAAKAAASAPPKPTPEPIAFAETMEATQEEVRDALASHTPPANPPKEVRAAEVQPPLAQPEPASKAAEPDMDNGLDRAEVPKKKSSALIFVAIGLVALLGLGCIGSVIGAYFYMSFEDTPATVDETDSDEVETEDETGQLRPRFQPPDRTSVAHYEVGEHKVTVAAGATGYLAMKSLGLDPGFRDLGLTRTQGGKTVELNTPIYVPPDVTEDFSPWLAGKSYYFLKARVPVSATFRLGEAEVETVEESAGLRLVQAKITTDTDGGKQRVAYSLRDTLGEEEIVLSGHHTTVLPSRGPALVITSPLYGRWVSEKVLRVKGVTSPGAEVKVNGAQIEGAVQADGNFDVSFNAAPGDNEIEVEATSRGATSTIGLLVKRVRARELRKARKGELPKPSAKVWGESAKDDDVPVGVDAVLGGVTRVGGETVQLAHALDSNVGTLAFHPTDRVLVGYGAEIRVVGLRGDTLRQRDPDGSEHDVHLLRDVALNQ